MKNERGFTLVELLIAMIVILIGALGFFSWATVMIHSAFAIEKNNTAYSMVIDVAERLQRMPDNQLIQPSTSRYVGFDDGSDLDYDGVTFELNGCGGLSNTPSINITAQDPGMTIYTNPWGGGKLYLYDNNTCSDLNPYCFSSSTIEGSANSNLDHPNSISSTYRENINPIRFYRNTTYYAVWSIAYMPCSAGDDTTRRKIFVTVYWIDPEPIETTLLDVEAKIASGDYTIKSVSLVVDKTIGAEG